MNLCLLRRSLPALWLLFTVTSAFAQNLAGQRIDGFRGIWFDLGQANEYGSKYSGGLGTYTAKHRPLAIYSAEANKTFFVYGGTDDPNKRHLLAMISCYDHATGQLAKPMVVHDKETVNDPHDNPSLSLDDAGHLWVFVSGRGRARPGFIYRSSAPYSIDAFERVAETEFTYPQPWWVKGKGFVHMYTKYTAGRELYWNTSDSTGTQWGGEKKLAAMGGHYQVSAQKDGVIISAFNMHPGGNVDKRTNLYFVRSPDLGKIWTTADGTPIETPLVDPACAALVHDYQSEGRLVYVKDIDFDAKTNPVILTITSSDHAAGPAGDPRVWTLTRWTGERWVIHEVTRSTHNYDMGSLYLESEDLWRIIAPTEPGPQHHGAGGEIAVWASTDQGRSWMKTGQLTIDSELNHGYVRRPENAHPGFYAFWSDGDADRFSRSHLYFTDKACRNVWRMPYDFEGDFAPAVPLYRPMP